MECGRWLNVCVCEEIRKLLEIKWYFFFEYIKKFPDYQSVSMNVKVIVKWYYSLDLEFLLKNDFEFLTVMENFETFLKHF
jgi:hypothetical protein